MVINLRLQTVIGIFLLAFTLLIRNGWAIDYLFSPDQGAVVDNNRPLIRLAFPGGTVDPGSVRMVINGSDVTGAAMKTPSTVMYTPSSPLLAGKNRVEVSYRAADGSVKNVSWEFTIQPEQLIHGIEHDADIELIEGDTVTVTVYGKPGIKGTFDLDGFRKNLPLTEMKQGIYKGSYKVISGDQMIDGYVVAHMNDNDGSSFSQTSATPVNIDARFFKAKIYTPKNLDKVGQNFQVVGRTRPDTVVYLSSQLGFNSGYSGPVGAPATRQLQSDSQGYFTYDYFFPITMKGLKATISVHSVDDKGNRSLPDQVMVYIEGEDKKPAAGGVTPTNNGSSQVK